MKQVNKHVNYFVAPSFRAGLRNLNIYYDAVHGVISKGACLIKEGVNALSCYCDFIPRPEGRGYRYIQSVKSRTGSIEGQTSSIKSQTVSFPENGVLKL